LFCDDPEAIPSVLERRTDFLALAESKFIHGNRRVFPNSPSFEGLFFLEITGLACRRTDQIDEMDSFYFIKGKE
jgi:hypothetical protein